MSHIQFVWKQQNRNNKEKKIFALASDNYFAAVYQYHIYNDECAFFIKQNISIPNAMMGLHDAGYAQSSDGNYLFICGGYTEEIADNYKHCTQIISAPSERKVDPFYTEEFIISPTVANKKNLWFKMQQRQIFAFDLNEMKIYQSCVRLPKSMAGSVKAICLDNKDEDEFIVNSFINSLFRKIHFRNLMKLPFYLIQIVVKFFSNNYLHVMQMNQQTQNFGLHYKIDITYIITAINKE